MSKKIRQISKNTTEAHLQTLREKSAGWPDEKRIALDMLLESYEKSKDSEDWKEVRMCANSIDKLFESMKEYKKEKINPFMNNPLKAVK